MGALKNSKTYVYHFYEVPIINKSLDALQVCYSFWVLSSLSILNKLSLINSDKLTTFILSAQVSCALT